MTKVGNTLFIIFLIVAQSALAIAVGVAALLYLSKDVVPSGVYVGEQGIYIGGLSYTDAVKAIEADCAGKFKHKSLLVDVENSKTYELSFSQIGAIADGNATIRLLGILKGIKDIPEFLNTQFGHFKPVLQPIVRFNEGKLRQALMELSEKINVAPTDASISYKNGVIDKKAETNGISLNITNTVEVIRNQLSTDPWGTVKLSRSGNFELQAVVPSVKIIDFDEIQQVFSEYTTQIVDEELSESIKSAADAINGEFLPAAADKGNPSVFSFVERLTAENAEFENNNEGYDQVASTLYAALLSAGVPVNSITRLPHKLSVDYIEPGLDAWISGDAGDLKFFNPFNHKIAIFAQTEGDKVKVVIAGSISDKKGKYEIETEITQRFASPVYYVENKSLRSGEKVILDPGREGIMVNVFRNGELIGSDTYEAEKKIVQIGPGTDWKDGDK